MRRLVDNLQKTLVEFVEQRDDLILLLQGDDAAAAISMKLLRGIEASDPADVFLLMAHDFERLNLFVDAAVAHLAQEHARTNAALQEEGRAPLATFPTGALDAARPPIDRLRDALAFMRSLIPRRGGHRLVVMFCPMRVADVAGYAGLIGDLAPRDPVPGWLQGMRIILRCTPEMSAAVETLKAAPRTRVGTFDFTRDAIETSLQEEAADERTPEAARAGALVQLAAFDTAFGRSAAALTKYELLLGLFQKTENPLMESHVLNGMGDAHRRGDDAEKAMASYECAIAPAVEAKSAPMLQVTMRNLASLEYELGHFDRAEQYFDLLLRAAQHNQDANTIVLALEYRGLAREQQNHLEPALESFDDAVVFCGEVALISDLKRNLGHLERVASRSGKADKVRAVRLAQKELATLGDAA